MDSNILLSSEGKERAVPLRGSWKCSEECWTSASEHPPQSQSRIGFLVGTCLVGDMIASWRRAESHSPPVRDHLELRKRIFPPLQKKNIEKAEHLLQLTEFLRNLPSKTNKSLALWVYSRKLWSRWRFKIHTHL